VLSTQVKTVGLHLRGEISAWCPGRRPRLIPMPAAVAARCCQRKYQ
jgi:hypothetical protein